MNDPNDRRTQLISFICTICIQFECNDEWVSLMGIEIHSCEKNKSEMTKNLFHSEQTDPISELKLT